MSITLAQICNAVETTLAAATGLTYTQSYNELEEGMNDTPTLQVYWNSSSKTRAATTDRTTFKAVLSGRRTLRFIATCTPRTRNEDWRRTWPACYRWWMPSIDVTGAAGHQGHISD